MIIGQSNKLACNKTAMKLTSYVRSESEPIDDILSILQGRVFHVTKHKYLSSILADGQIKPNADGDTERKRE